MDTAGILSCAYFLVGSILSGLGLIVCAGTVIILNNMFQKYWKPVRWNYYVPIEYKDPNKHE